MSVNESSVRDKYHRLTKLLIDQNLMITAMESATSGQIASLITDTEGSSAIFKGSFVTYIRILCPDGRSHGHELCGFL